MEEIHFVIKTASGSFYKMINSRGFWFIVMKGENKIVVSGLRYEVSKKELPKTINEFKGKPVLFVGSGQADMTGDVTMGASAYPRKKIIPGHTSPVIAAYQIAQDPSKIKGSNFLVETKSGAFYEVWITGGRWFINYRGIQSFISGVGGLEPGQIGIGGFVGKNIFFSESPANNAILLEKIHEAKLHYGNTSPVVAVYFRIF